MPRGRAIFLASALFAGGFLFFITTTRAENATHLVISQIQITGGAGKTAHDFIEIHNPTDGAVNLNGYRLVKRTQTGSSDTLIKSFTDDFYLGAGAYFLWANSDYSDIPTLPNATTSAAIAPDNAVALRFGGNDAGTIIDSVAWGLAQNAFVEGAAFPQNPGTGEVLLRQHDDSDSNNNAADFIIAPPSPRRAEPSAPAPAVPPTPPPQTNNENTAAPSSPPADSAISTDMSCSNIVLVNELIINPEDSNADYEFIELHNQTDSEKDISGWILEDAQGRTTKFTIPAGAKIAARGYLTFYRPQTKITLNNSGDGAKLSNAAGQICDASPHNSGAADEDVSYSRKENNWVWTSSVTPNAANMFTEPKSSNRAANESGGSSAVSADKTPPLAASSTIIINEFLPNPKGADADKEFIELKNIGTTDLILANWRLENSGRKKYTFPASTVMKAHSYLVIENKESGINLKNDDETLKLIDADEQIADQIHFDEQAEENFSYNRMGTTSTLWQWSKVISPGAENFIVPPNHPPTIIFSLPNVAEVDEEIFFDASNSADPEEDALFFTWNFGDKTEAIGVTSTHAYTRAGKFKITLTVNDYHGHILKETAAVTIIGDEETAVEAEETMKKKTAGSINKIKTKKWLRLVGTVIAPPGLFGNQYFYLQDDDGQGAQIYMFKKDFPKLKIGDKVETAGETSETQNGLRIKIKKREDVKFRAVGRAMEPEESIIADLNEERLGGLVKIRGEVLEPKSGQFYLADDSGEILAQLKSRAGLKGGIVKEGDEAEVTGILAASKGALAVWPRFADDIKILNAGKNITEGGENENKGKINNFFSATTGGLAALLAAFAARSRGAVIKGLAVGVIGKIAFWRKKDEPPLS